MSIRNNVTYTLAIVRDGQPMRGEYSTAIYRDRKLTHAGAERILRRELEDDSLIVTRIEVMSMDDPRSNVRAVMSLLGKRKTTAKAAAARANGKKGGRPRKKPVATFKKT